MSSPPLLMIPGPVMLSPAVREAIEQAPLSHVAPDFIEAFGASLELMRGVWKAGRSSQPFIVAGGGTIAMEMAVCNLIEPGARVVVVDTGYFSERMSEMLRRRGADIVRVGAAFGDVPDHEAIEAALGKGVVAVFVTHVDTSTGVRIDAGPIARAARERGILSIFDGVCATAGETFEMEEWGADVYLTASQKALGVPPGLALMVASTRAMAARAALTTPPPMSLDWEQWLPIMAAYEARRPSYFSTPATSLVTGLHRSLLELTSDAWGEKEGIDARIARNHNVASVLRGAWQKMGLDLVPASGAIAADTMSAIAYPDGVGSELLGRIKAHGAVVAGGLYPGRQGTYFRVGHMGDVLTRLEALTSAIAAVGRGLEESGCSIDVEGVVAAAREQLS